MPILWNARQALESSSFIPFCAMGEVNQIYLTCQVIKGIVSFYGKKYGEISELGLERILPAYRATLLLINTHNFRM